MLRRRIMAFVALSLGSVVVVACFPDFHVGDGGGPTGSGQGDATTLDARVPEARSDGSGTGTGPPSTDAATDALSSEGGPIGEGGPGLDAATSTARFIPRGKFNFLSPGSPASTTQVTLTHDLYMDTHEETVAAFRAWVAAARPVPTGSLDPGGPYQDAMVWNASFDAEAASDRYKDTSCTQPYGTSNSNTGPTYNGAVEQAPITCLNWAQAAALCWFDGQKRLPTGVEWQYVASGRNRERTYPWGDTPMPGECSLVIWRRDAGAASEFNGCAFPTAVGSAPAGASFDGVEDLAGSVFEWTWDFTPQGYPSAWPDDYAGPDAGLYRMIRGGGFGSLMGELETRHMSALDTTETAPDIGVRCVKTKL